MNQASVWTGGLAPETDWVFAACPDDPKMIESVSLWFIADDGSFAAPRIGIEAEAANWGMRRYQGNFALAGGRVVIGPGIGPPPGTLDDAGRPAVIGAGPLTFRCLEPFRRWTASFDGSGADGHVRDQLAGKLDPARRTALRFDCDMTMAAPAWSQVMSGDSAEAGFMGVGYRFEQLYRAVASLQIDGTWREVTGTGLRIHRQSRRALAGFRGHCWQTALFPDGRAFGVIAYPDHDDGRVSYNEGFVWDGARMIRARYRQAPWLRTIVESGGDVSLVLESDLGETRIEGTTTLSTFRIGNPDIGGLDLQQSAVRYRWGGQEAWGMIERSSPATMTTMA